MSQVRNGSIPFGSHAPCRACTTRAAQRLRSVTYSKNLRNSQLFAFVPLSGEAHTPIEPREQKVLQSFREIVKSRGEVGAIPFGPFDCRVGNCNLKILYMKGTKAETPASRAGVSWERELCFIIRERLLL